MSNLGYWTIKPVGKSKLGVSIAPYKANYKHPHDHDTFVAVIDGLSGKVQKKLGGSQILRDAQDNFGSQGEARASFTHTRQIGMYYQINLGRNNRFAKTILKAIQNQEITFRTCFMDALEINPDLQRQSKIFLPVAKANGAIDKVKHQGGSIKNKKMVQCLYYNLGAMQFPLSRNIGGSITFIFKTS